MTATLTPRFDNAAFGCGRAQIRAHYRHLATVVTIIGLIDSVNVDAVTAYTQRFILAKDPLILDLSDVRISTADAVTLMRTLAQDCRAAGVECMLVAPGALAEVAGDDDFPLAGSVHEALHCFADEINARRQLLLPLIKKSA
ncbi:MAG: STAS domain-containing protein [Candidatus Sericytochromatia bacterium]